MNVECEHGGEIRLVLKNAAVKASLWQDSQWRSCFRIAGFLRVSDFL